jgi:formylglycine-generating enzyme required for sulfatase activity
VLLAGFYSDDCTPVINWLAQAQPEVAVQCILNSGAHTPDETLRRLRLDWLPRLTDLDRHPEPEARAAFGRALGMLTLDGEALDNRPGVALRYEAKLRRRVPDIAWVEVPAGPFFYQDGETLALPRFHIARYPVTNCQFKAFIDDPEGFANPQWWEGLAERYEQPKQASWDYTNHPRETVSWYEAVAYCRWLTHLLGDEVRLPTAQEWEKAARGSKGLEYPGHEYPWGDGYKYKPGYANIRETDGNAGPHYLEQTSAVGIYPQGRSPFGALDMAGNVCEWCLNEYEQLGAVDMGGNFMEGEAERDVQGGSWLNSQDLARCPAQVSDLPDSRSNDVGFRVVLCSPPVV